MVFLWWWGGGGDWLWKCVCDMAKGKKNRFNYTLRGFQTPVSHDFNLAVIGMSHDIQPGKHIHTHCFVHQDVFVILIPPVCSASLTFMTNSFFLLSLSFHLSLQHLFSFSFFLLLLLVTFPCPVFPLRFFFPPFDTPLLSCLLFSSPSLMPTLSQNCHHLSAYLLTSCPDSSVFCHWPMFWSLCRTFFSFHPSPMGFLTLIFHLSFYSLPWVSSLIPCLFARSLPLARFNAL